MMARRAAGSAEQGSRTGSAVGAPAAAARKGRGGSSGSARGGRGGRGGRGARREATTGFKGSARGKHLVIVESPSKAKTINKYLGPGYVVLASVGHVRDLPSSDREAAAAVGENGTAKGVKGAKGKGARAKRARSPVPGVDLEHGFRPTYVVLPEKRRVIAELKKAARESMESGCDVWFATDLDREGEAIAWHLAQELGIPSEKAKRVIFAAITKGEIERAFHNPHGIDEDRVNAQQARRILDRIVGYQVSPLLWKKVARGLSAGRVQSVAVRLVVEREREIRAHVPDEEWTITGCFAGSAEVAGRLSREWREFVRGAAGGAGGAPTLKAQTAWLNEAGAVRAELVEFEGRKFEPAIRVDGIIGPLRELTAEAIGARLEAASRAFADAGAHDVTPEVVRAATACGMKGVRVEVQESAEGRGPARWRRSVEGEADAGVGWTVASLETKPMRTRPLPPFITSTMQQAAASRLGFGAQRAMRAAQQLYEGVEIPGEGPVGLITYMRTDSTHLSGEALEMARTYIGRAFGARYLPEKPNFYTSSNKDAQEAHEAIRPTSLEYPPARVRGALTGDQYRLYELIWDRFVASQMTAAEWEQTTAQIRGGRGSSAVFRASGRVLVFDGFLRVAGVPRGEEPHLPALREGQRLSAFALEARQRFTQAPARYTEASLIKTLESEGIGRPSTYASIVQVIQDRKYVELEDRRFRATDLGEVVTDKLVEAFPRIMDVGYTREMEGELDKVEEEHIDWVEMLERFYGPFKESLEAAHETMSHAKAEVRAAPREYRCGKCGSGLVYRFGRNGRFLSCERYPQCDYACPCDREGRPRPVETTNVACPKCGSAMGLRTGRFGAFLGCSRYNAKENPCDGIVRLDKTGRAVAPSPPAMRTELDCPACARARAEGASGREGKLVLRSGIRGPWLGCELFPRCRGRGNWKELSEEERKKLERALAAHEKAHPVVVIRTLDGEALTDSKGKPLATAPVIGAAGAGGAGVGSAGVGSAVAEGGGEIEAGPEEAAA